MAISSLDMEQGATFRVALTWTDALNAPVSTVGYRAHMQVRYKVGSPVLIDMTSANGGITLGGVNGMIALYASAAQTALVKKNALYDLHLVDLVDPNEVIRVFGGAINLVPAVTVG